MQFAKPMLRHNLTEASLTVDPLHVSLLKKGYNERLTNIALPFRVLEIDHAQNNVHHHCYTITRLLYCHIYLKCY